MFIFSLFFFFFAGFQAWPKWPCPLFLLFIFSQKMNNVILCYSWNNVIHRRAGITQLRCVAHLKGLGFQSRSRRDTWAKQIMSSQLRTKNDPLQDEPRPICSRPTGSILALCVWCVLIPFVAVIGVLVFIDAHNGHCVTMDDATARCWRWSPRWFSVCREDQRMCS
jgi:hypothetical protein